MIVIVYSEIQPARPRAAGSGARAHRLHGNFSFTAALPYSQSESLHWRNLALGYDPAGFLFTDDGSAEIRDFSC